MNVNADPDATAIRQAPTGSGNGTAGATIGGADRAIASTRSRSKPAATALASRPSDVVTVGGMLGDRHQPEVAVTPDELFVAAKAADDWKVEWLDGLTQELFVRVGGDAVQHHAREPHARIVIAIAAHERRAPTRSSPTRRRPTRLARRAAVRHRPSTKANRRRRRRRGPSRLRRRGGRAARGACRQRRDRLGSTQPRVEVAAGTPAGERVIPGIDEVRTDLGRRDTRYRVARTRPAARWQRSSCPRLTTRPRSTMRGPSISARGRSRAPDARPRDASGRRRVVGRRGPRGPAMARDSCRCRSSSGGTPWTASCRRCSITATRSPSGPK